MPDRDPAVPDPEETDLVDTDPDAEDDDLTIPMPVRRTDDGVVLDLGDDETALIRRLLGELRTMLTVDDPGDEARALLVRLFPAAYPDDEAKESEYQRLMRDELVQSKLAAFDVVDDALDGRPLDEAGHLAVMQSVNSIRLVLGVMLDVSDDPDTEVAEGFEESPEYALYAYLSWLLEMLVTTAA